MFLLSRIGRGNLKIKGPIYRQWTMRVLVCVLIFLLPQSVQAADDPEIRMTDVEMIRHWGYPVEVHDVTTEDGYILDLFRIPYGRFTEENNGCKRPVVLMLHGLLGSGTQFVLNPPESSPAFVLADAGFDVFLLNHRGTAYGMRHQSLKSSDNQFWQFTLDELAKYDALAAIDKSLQLSGDRDLYVIGYSVGTLVGFMALAENPDYNSKLYRMMLGSHPIIASPSLAVGPQIDLCAAIPLIGPWFCYNLFGADPPSATFNATRIPVYVSHQRGGTSTWTYLHLGQIATRRTVEHMDHNPTENVKRYGQETPPPYDYGNIEVPVYLFWSRNDWLTPPEELENVLLAMLKEDIVKGIFDVSGYSHDDFGIATDNADRVYKPIANIVRNQERNMCEH